MNEPLVVLRTVLYHRERVDEVTVDRVERPSVVIGGSTDRGEVDRQICHLDEAFEARVVLDVDAVELDAAGPGEGLGLEEVPDLVVVDVEGEHLVRRLRHQLLAQMGADEAPRADHAYGHRRDRPPVQIYSRHSPCSLSLSLSLESHHYRASS